MKLKTLKDLENNLYEFQMKEIRELAIKWVKEDINTDGRITMATLLWMKRLNITEDDLK